MRTCPLIITGFVLFGSFCLANWINRHDAMPPALAATSSTVDADLEQFQWHGQPIHPGVICQLDTDLADTQPLVAAVDLEGASNSQRFEPPQSQNGFLIYKDAREFDTGYFGYQYLGHSTDGKHMILTVMNTGGSGCFEDILIVKFSHDQLNNDGKLRDRICMKLVGHFVIGDRDNGKIEVQNDNLFISKSRYRDADKLISLTKDIPG